MTKFTPKPFPKIFIVDEIGYSMDITTHFDDSATQHINLQFKKRRSSISYITGFVTYGFSFRSRGS